MAKKYSFYEFFAGGGMARAGLGKGWRCVAANDFDKKKAQTYRANWDPDDLIVGDIRSLSPEHLPGITDLAWASFPCQDLSLAGGGAGLKGNRSGTFWPFISLMNEIACEGRAPRFIILENVLGTLSSHGGKDFVAIVGALSALGDRYHVGALVVDAAHFIPQSRPRVFVIALRADLAPAPRAVGKPCLPWYPKRFQKSVESLPQKLQEGWLWWTLPKPSPRSKHFIDIVESNPTGVSWHSKAETQTLLSMMSDLNLAKVRTAMNAGVPMVGGVYRRTRHEQGIKVQRTEVRFDRLAGCLRTPAGGSSRQMLLYIDEENVRSRLLSTREAARLMGLRDNYRLPAAYNEAYHLAGDGVAVPVVRYIARHILEPTLELNRTRSGSAAMEGVDAR